MFLDSNFINIARQEGFFSGIILMACLHGILLASILLFNKSLNSKSNKYLALSIFGICIIFFFEFIYWLQSENLFPNWFYYLPIYIRTTIPVGIFYFVLFLINPEHKLSNFEKIGYVLIGIELLLALIYIPMDIMAETVEESEYIEYWIILVSWFLNTIAIVLLLPRALRKVNTYQNYLYNNYSTTDRKSLKWLQSFLIIFLIIALVSVVSFVQYVLGYWEGSETTFKILTICLLIILFWIGYFLVIQYKWFEIASVAKENNTLSGKLSSNTQQYYHQLKALLNDENIYEDVNLTLDNLANRLDISSGYLSQIIKENEQKNFFEFINTYRITSVKEKLLDSSYQDYTIMGIAMESGFNSKSTFNAVFKKIANETPSAFKRRHLKLT